MAGTSILQIILRVTKEGTGERQAAKEAKELKGTLGELGLGSLASASALGILSGAVIAAGNYLREGMVKAEESNKVLAKQEAILKATGYAAGLNARELDTMAMSLANLSGMDDDVIRDAQSMLLTFREIGDDVMPRAAQAVLDLSTTFGGVSQSATQVGKALNAPLTGMTALAKSGVTFSDVQKDMIRNFVEMGDVASAQDIILSEIEAQVGGTAAAMEQASSGAGRMQVAYDDLQIEMASGMLPAQREWNLLLAETYASLAKTIRLRRQEAQYHKEVADQLELTSEQYRKARAYSEEFANKTDAMVNQMKRGAEMTEYATALYKGMGGSISELMGYTDNYTESLEMSEEAMKAITTANENFMKGVENMQSLEDSYAKNVQSNAEERKKIEQEKAEYIAQYGEWNVAELAKFDDALVENSRQAQENANEQEIATKRVILGYMERKLMADGMLDDKETEWLLKKGTEWGIYSETAIQAFKDAMAEGDEYMAFLKGIPSNIVTIAQFKVQNTGGGGSGGGAAYAYASGTDGWETVPAGYPNDSYPILLTSGEKFAVIPNGGGAETFAGVGVGGGGGTQQVEVVVRFAGDAEKMFAPMVERIMKARR